MALISTAEQLKQYLPMPYSNTLNSLPKFDIAEERHLISIIGMTGYAAISGNTLNSAELKLLDNCRGVVAPFAYVYHLPFTQVQLSDNGLLAVEPNQARKAFKWEYNAVKEELLSIGYSRQEMLILWLEANKSSFAWWSTAPYNNSDFAIIRNGKELSESIAIAQPHRSYMMLKPIFDEVGSLTLADMLGESFYAALTTKIKAQSLNADEAALVKQLRHATARKAMSKAARLMNVQFHPSHGFTIAENSKDSNDGRTNADEYQIAAFERELTTSANAFLEKAIKTLNTKASAELFAEYFTSSRYSNPYTKPATLKQGRRGMFTA